MARTIKNTDTRYTRQARKADKQRRDMRKQTRS